MDRVAVFSDSGYLYGGGSVAIADFAHSRVNLELKLGETIAKLEATARERADGAALLRIYWYDGLLGVRLSLEQEALANMDNVKVRLGAVTAGQQKGVDSLIVTDLIELARNRAISDAVLLSGDEDLRIGVQIAQSFGVRVHLLGIEPSRGNQSHLLRQEADTTSEWSKGEIEEILSVKAGAGANRPVSPVQEDVGAGGDVINDILERVAAEIVGLMGENDVRAVAQAIAMDPRWIPLEYDRKLLAGGRERMGRELNPGERRRVRDGFRGMVASRA